METNQRVRQESMVLNYIYNLLFQILALIVPLITTPYVARVLRADGVGAYSYALSIVTYFVMFGNLGIATYGQIKIASVRNDARLRSKTFWEILISRSISMVLMLVAYIGFSLILNLDGKLMIALSLTIFAAIFDITWFLQGLENFKTIVIRNSIIKIISVFLIFIFVRSKEDLIIYAIILQGSTLLGNLSIIPYAKNYLVKITLSNNKILHHLRSSLIFFIPSVATSVYTVFNKIMLGWISNSTLENGYYEQSLKIVQIAITIVTSISTVTLPRMTFLHSSQNKKEIKNILRYSVQFILFFSIPMTLGLILLSNKVIPWFLGSGYGKSIVLLQIFSFLIISIGLNNIIGQQCLLANGNIKKYNFSIICGAIINFILNIFMIPILSSVGAAIVTVLTELLILVLFIYFSREWITIKDIIIYSRKYVISSIIMGAAITFMGINLDNSFSNILILVLIGIVVYFVSLFLLRDKLVNIIFKKIMAKYKNIWR